MATLIRNSVCEYNGLGPSLLSQVCREQVSQHDVPADRMEARAMLHDRSPLTPGVYAWLDCNDQICYVGKSKCLRKRLLSYFAKTPADKKAVRIVQHSHRLVWEPMTHELLALIREQELIHRWRPDFNTQGQPVRRQPAFVCISGGLAPQAYFTRRVTEKATRAFGPIHGTSRLRQAVDSLNQVFKLRDCPDKTQFQYSNQQQLFDDPATPKCIRFELGTCPAPCAARCSAAEYLTNVNAATRFLEGGAAAKQAAIILEAAMQQASADCAFERAVVLRDHLKNLKWLTRRLDALEKAKKKFNGVLPLIGKNHQKLWLVLRGGQIAGSAAAPSGIKRLGTAVERLTTIAEQDIALPTDLMQMNLQMIMISWFRKYPEYKKQLLSFEESVEMCERKLAKFVEA